MGEVIGRDLAALPYPERLEALNAASVGLWDVFAGAERRGSLDTAIRNVENADLVTLATTLPRLGAIAFNGGLAARTGRRVLAGITPSIELIDLPSSSPAHARPFADKAATWAVLKAALAG